MKKHLSHFRSATLLLVSAKILLLVASSLFCACEHDTYEWGDGRYSHLTARFTEVHTTTNALLDYAVSDEGDTLRFVQKRQMAGLAVADTAYRALLYYNPSGAMVRLVNLSLVPVVKPVADETALSDPLTFESAWIGKNKKYLNISFYVKTGQSGLSDKRQQIGVVLDSVVTAPNGHPRVYLRLSHSQNGVPEYYSVHGYLSIPLKTLPAGATIRLRVVDYRGVKVKQLKTTH